MKCKTTNDITNKKTKVIKFNQTALNLENVSDKKLIETSFSLLYPDRTFNYNTKLRYSGRFSDYNATVQLSWFFGKQTLEFRLCKKWKDVSTELKVGLVQELLVKLFKKRGRTTKKDYDKLNTLYIDMYNSFVKNLHIAVPKDKIDPELKESFDRVNQRYFLGVVETPNLVWGAFTKRKLGSYDYKADTILMSGALQGFLKKNPEFVDIVMYHEMLHKQNKFRTCNGRTLYHDKKFKQAERMFENFHETEKRLNHALRYVRRPAGEHVPFQKKKRKQGSGFLNKLFGS